MAQISNSRTTYTCSTVVSGATPTSASVSAYAINNSGTSTNTNWGTAGFGASALFGSTTTATTGTFSASSTADGTGAAVTVTWVMNPSNRTLTFTAPSAAWVAFCFDETGATAFDWDDTGWSVTGGANVNTLFLWGRNVRHTSGFRFSGQGGFLYSIIAPFGNGLGLNLCPTVGNNGTVINWFGCQITGPNNANRSDFNLNFFAGATGRIQNFSLNNTTSTNTALPNVGISVPAPNLSSGITGFSQFDRVSCLRGVWSPGTPQNLTTTSALDPTNLLIGQNANWYERTQSYGPQTFVDFQARGPLTATSTWRSNRFRVGALRADGRSPTGTIYNGWQYVQDDTNLTIQPFTNFYTDPGSRTVSSTDSHVYEYGYPSQSAANQGRYDVAFQANYTLTTNNASGQFLNNVLVSVSDQSQTRHLPRYFINTGTGVMDLTSVTTPRAQVITSLAGGRTFLASALYLYGINDTNSTVGNSRINFTNAMNVTGTNQTLSPAGTASTGNPTTFDATRSQRLYICKWGSRLQTQDVTVGTSQLSTDPNSNYSFALPNDPFIRNADNTSGDNTFRTAAQNLQGNGLAFTQASASSNSALTQMVVSTALLGNQVYEGMEAWARNISQQGGYLRPYLTAWSDPSATADDSITFLTLTQLTLNGTITTWTPTVGRTSIKAINMPAASTVFLNAAGSQSTMNITAPTLNFSSSTVGVPVGITYSGALTGFAGSGSWINAAGTLNATSPVSITFSGNSTASGTFNLTGSNFAFNGGSSSFSHSITGTSNANRATLTSNTSFTVGDTYTFSNVNFVGTTSATNANIFIYNNVNLLNTNSVSSTSSVVNYNSSNIGGANTINLGTTGFATFSGSTISGTHSVTASGAVTYTNTVNNASAAVSVSTSSPSGITFTGGSVNQTFNGSNNSAGSTSNPVFTLSGGVIVSQPMTLSYTGAGTAITSINNATFNANTQVPYTSTTQWSPTATLGVGAVLTIANGAVAFTLDAAGLAFGNAAATLARAAGSTGTITLINWPQTKTVPPGFQVTTATTIQLTLLNPPAVAPTIRSAELYRNGGSTNLLVNTPTYANGVFTWPNLSSNAADTLGGIVYVDGYQPTRMIGISNASSVVGTAQTESNIDFGQSLVTADTNFIATTSWDSTNIGLATSPYAKMTTSTAVDYTTSPSSRSAVEKAKLVLRRTFETSDAGTVAFRRQIALGNLATNFIAFTQTGLVVSQVTGVATSGVGIQINKTATSVGPPPVGNSSVVTVAIWAVDAGGDFYNLNTANGRLGTSPTVLILWEGFSPGAVANINSNQIGQIADGVQTSLASTLSALPAQTRSTLRPDLAVINTNVQFASLSAPTSTNLPNLP